MYSDLNIVKELWILCRMNELVSNMYDDLNVVNMFGWSELCKTN
jgi:hypothetical protein